MKKIIDSVNWRPFEMTFRKLYSHGERRPAWWEPVKLFRRLLPEKWYGLSDRDLEELLAFRFVFMKFVGLPLDKKGPDAAAFVVFRRRIERCWKKMLGLIKNQLEEDGHQVDKAVDAHSWPQKKAKGRRPPAETKTPPVEALHRKRRKTTTGGRHWPRNFRCTVSR